MILEDSRDIPILARNFSKAINRWFELLKNLPDKPWGIDEMVQLSPGLAQLCMLAYRLPMTDYYENDDPNKVNDTRESICIHIDFEEQLRHYYTLLYPYEGIGNRRAGPDIPIKSDLVDDMYDICNSLFEGLEYYDKGMPYKAVSLWRDLFLRRWGELASQTLYVMDYAIRDYLCEESLGKHDVPFDYTFYPAVKYLDLDGSFILHLDPNEALLPYELLINTLGLAEDDIPMIGVAVGEKVIFVSVSDDPENLSRINFPDQEMIFGWIKGHKELLLNHWYKEISDQELVNTLYSEVMDILYPDHK